MTVRHFVSHKNKMRLKVARRRLKRSHRRRRHCADEGGDEAGDHRSRKRKIHFGKPEFHGERLAARTALAALPQSAQLSAAERQQREGEDEEPVVVPG